MTVLTDALWDIKHWIRALTTGITQNSEQIRISAASIDY